MTEIGHKGCKELLFRRMSMAVVSSIIVQFFFVSCVVLITHLSITKPLSWLEDTWSIITCFRMWCHFLVLALVIVLQGVVCSKNYLKSEAPTTTRFAVFCSLLTPHNFLVGALNLTIGIVLVWLHLAFEEGNYSSFSKPCKEGSCLVEEHSFLLMAGVWTGAYYFIKNSFSGRKYLKFPIIPQNKFTQIRREITLLLPTAMSSAIWPTLYFLAFYYTFGGYLRVITASTFFLNLDDEPLASISHLMNFKLIFHTWLYSCLFALTMNSMHLLFQTHLTEPMHFEIQSVYNNQSSVSLPEALAMEKVPIIQHLAYLDLLTIAQKEKTRRAVIFALSQPGGHPYNWNCIIEKSLELLKKYSKDIEEVYSVKQDSLPIKTIPPAFERQQNNHMRNLIASTATTPEINLPKQTPSNSQMFNDFINSKKQSIINYLLSKPLIGYFFGERSDSKLQHLLITGQPVIWAMDAVSSLAVVSLEEDSYGVVQKDLPTIIEHLLNLKQTLDKLHKMHLLTRKPQYDDKVTRIMLASLRTANKRSVYRIVMKFKEYIDDLTLEQTVKDQLQMFICCRE